MIEMICNNKRYKNSTPRTVLLSDEDKDLSEMLWTVIGHGYAFHRERGFLHRMILERMIGRPIVKGEEVDHHNLNKLDNQRKNLRLSSRSQNAINRALQSNNTTGYRGIWLRWDKKKWCAEIKDHGKKVYLGCFSTKEEAAAAYDKAAREAQGEFFIGNDLN